MDDIEEDVSKRINGRGEGQQYSTHKPRIEVEEPLFDNVMVLRASMLDKWYFLKIGGEIRIERPQQNNRKENNTGPAISETT
jgi:hypothetical protein